MKPLIDQAKLLQTLVTSYDVEAGEKVSVAKIYNMILSAPTESPSEGYWYPAMDENGWRCSVCGHDICYNTFEGDDECYCKSCGSYMINHNEFMLDNKKRDFELI